MTTEDLVDVYERIYSAKGLKIDGKEAVYGDDAVRDQRFIGYVTENLCPGSYILDASCGRGHLARSLLSLRYDVEVTEISDSVIRDSLVGLNVHKLAYSDLWRIGKIFDAVISNDVLEHLSDESMVRDGLYNLASCTRPGGLLLVSVGCGPKAKADKWPKAMKFDFPDLHLFNATAGTWRGLLSEYMTIDWSEIGNRTFYFFGRVKK